MNHTWQTEDGRVLLYLADCNLIIKQLQNIDVVITDPPWGINKEDWDTHFPSEIISSFFKIADRICVISGIDALGSCITAMSKKYIWTICGHKAGGATNGKIGINKWTPAVVGGTLPPSRFCDAFDFYPADKHNQIYHPCQKPLQFMLWLVNHLSENKDTILDPYMGSGSIGVACVQTGRKFIGIEIDKTYFDIALKRIQNELKQQRFNI